MPKTLRDLNWNLFVVNLASAILLGVVISLAGEFNLKGAAVTIASCAAKDMLAFFSQAKKILEEE